MAIFIIDFHTWTRSDPEGGGRVNESGDGEGVFIFRGRGRVFKPKWPEIGSVNSDFLLHLFREWCIFAPPKGLRAD